MTNELAYEKAKMLYARAKKLYAEGKFNSEDMEMAMGIFEMAQDKYIEELKARLQAVNDEMKERGL